LEAAIFVQQLYVGYYGRPADPQGLDYWQSRLDSGPRDGVLTEFGASGEFDQRFGGLSAEVLVGNLYSNLFGREPDSEGLQFYTQRLEGGEFELIDIAVRVADGAIGGDERVLDNRLVGAGRFTDQVENKQKTYDGADAIRVATEFLESIDGDAAPDAAEVAAVVEQLETRELTLAAALDAEDLPAAYQIDAKSSYQADGGLSFSDAEALYESAREVVSGAVNSEDLRISELLDYQLTDRYESLVAQQDAPVFSAAESYTFTDPRGSDFGFLSAPERQFAFDGENFSDYLFRPVMDGSEGRIWPEAGEVSPVMVRILSTFQSGGETFRTQGSGVLVGPNDILTAAHVIYPDGLADRVSVAPGYDQGDAAYGTYSVTETLGYPVESYGGRISLAQSTYDMALLHTAEPLGYQFGYMDINPVYFGGDVMVSGYPGSADGEQVTSQGSAAERQASLQKGGREYWVYDDPDQSPGSSGGPLWVYEDGVPSVAGNVSTNSWAYDVSNDESLIQNQIVESNSFIDPDWAMLG
jgi:V8-like Glu-specific endopeptidase